MIQFGGIYYYLDLDALDRIVNTDNKNNDLIVVNETTTKTEKGLDETNISVTTKQIKEKELNFVKYEILRNCIEIILDTDDQGDVGLGAEGALEQMPMSYKVAFNTLYKYEIIKEQE